MFGKQYKSVSSFILRRVALFVACSSITAGLAGLGQEEKLDLSGLPSGLAEECRFLLEEEGTWIDGYFEVLKILALHKGEQGVEDFEHMLFSDQFKEVVKSAYTNSAEKMGFEEYYRTVQLSVANTCASLNSSESVRLLAKFYYGGLDEAKKLSCKEQVQEYFEKLYPDKDAMVSRLDGKGWRKKLEVLSTGRLTKERGVRIVYNVYRQGSMRTDFQARSVSNITVWLPVSSRVLHVE
jgi:hypothetical protein